VTSRWQQPLVDQLYVIAEAIPWFMVIALIASWGERDFLTQVADRIATEVGRSPQSVSVQQEVARAADTVITGPPVLVVLVTALAAFGLMRAFTKARLSGPLGAAAMLLLSLAVLNIMMHVTLARSLLFWEMGGLERFLADPASYFPKELDVIAFVQRPTIGVPHGAAATTSVIGLIVLWARFLVAGRSAVSFERVTRSFTIGFIVVLIAAIAAEIGEMGHIAGYAVPYFVMGVLTLAVAHSARPQGVMEGTRRNAPWMVSVLGTIGALSVTALMLGLLALFDVGSAFQLVADAIFRLFGLVLIIVITPIFWLMESLVRLLGISPGRELIAPVAIPTPAPPEQATGVEEERFRLAEMLLLLAKVVALTLLTYGAFVGIRMLLGRRRGEGDEEFIEIRTVDAPSTGLSALLRNIVPRRRGGGAGAEWMRRHEAYRLFGRAVRSADERGLSLRPGETPLEFAGVGARMLDARMFPAIAEQFDRARYGRHYPEHETLAPLERELAEWEAAHPATEELRERIRGVRAPSMADSVEARIVLAKRAHRGDENARRLLDEQVSRQL